MGTMRTSTTEASRRPPGPDGERVRRVLVSTALIGSAALTGLAVVWLFVPELDPHRSGDLESLGSVVFGPTASAVSTAAIGLAGVALAAALTRRGTHSRRWAALGAAGLSTLIAVVLGSLTTAVLAGYLFGMASVVAGIVTIGVMLVRSPRLGVVLLAGLLGLAAIAFWGAGITLAAAWSLATSFIGALAAAWQLLASATVILVTTLAWAAIAIIAIRVGPTGRAIETWLVRHRVALTVLAAIGPLPYAFARLSWLTPVAAVHPAAVRVRTRDARDRPHARGGSLRGEPAHARSDPAVGPHLPGVDATRRGSTGSRGDGSRAGFDRQRRALPLGRADVRDGRR